MTTTPGIARLRGRLAESGIPQQDLARELGLDESALSRILNGRRPMPDGFEARAHLVLDRLEAAERAAQRARERVLAEGK